MARPFGEHTTADEVADTFHDRIKGKTILITGVSPGGLGAYAVSTIAAHSPALLILASRAEPKISAVADELQTKYSGIKIRKLILDLSSLDAVRKAGAEVTSYSEKIDVLINNAAVMAIPFAKSPEGVEMHFAINHVGHFLFANLILRKLRKGSRVVNVASEGYRLAEVDYVDPWFEDGNSYGAMTAYYRSKSANILFTIALAERGIKAYALHPGSIKTPLQRHIPPELVDPIAESLGVRFTTVARGAASYIIAAFDPELDDEPAAYLFEGAVREPEPFCNKQNAERLWKFTENIIGQKF